MRNIYSFRCLPAMIVLLGCSTMFAQTVKTPAFTRVLPVIDNGERKAFQFMLPPGNEGCSTGAWGDYNNDGFLDLVLAGRGHNWNYHTVLHKNSGDGTFIYLSDNDPFPGVNEGSVCWFDYDNDGYLDLFIAGKLQDGAGLVSKLFRNKGPESNWEFEEVFAGVFPPLHNGGGAKSNRFVVAADYDNDGWTDLFLEGRNDDEIYGVTRHCLLFKNLKGQGWERIDNPVNGEQPFIQMNAGTAAWGDYNNDGYLDLLCFGYSDSDPLNVNDDGTGRSCTGALYRNKGDGTFAKPWLFPAGENGEIAWCDFNNDGWLDFVYTGYNYMSEDEGWQGNLYVNNQDGTFTAITDGAGITSFPGTGENSLAWGDVNNDGWEDLLMSRAHPATVFLNNNGDRTFTRADFKIESGEEIQTNDEYGAMVGLADWDNDGLLDANIPGAWNDWNAFHNDGGEDIPTNLAPTVPTNLKATPGEKEGTMIFTWDLSEDDHMPQGAIKYNLYVHKEGVDDNVMFVLPADKETGKLKVNELLAPITRGRYPMHGLNDGTKYVLGVSAIDNARISSRFATLEFIAGQTSTDPSIKKNMNVNISTRKGMVSIVATEALNATANVYNVSGANVFFANQVNNTISLPAGVYIVKVTAEAGNVVKKVVVQ